MPGGDFVSGGGHEHGNSATLIKVDKLRELIGNRISLPQLVVVGDQSSGKSSVLEGITGFAFPRDAGLCTRYATQITCRREDHESVTVTIIPHKDSDLDEAAKLKLFSRTLEKALEMDNDKLGEIFRDVNQQLGIGSASSTTGHSISGNAFSQHLLKIEICSPKQEHFTVIDVPGIFRKETKGLTTESDILLVKNMVMNYMKDSRTIILAIVPANVDPATQEILKLAKQVDPDMKRTMGVLTKPDLAIESAIQKIAIDHVIGKRSDLTLGYFIVKNRGPDHANMTFEEGQKDEKAFFFTEPWSILKRTHRAGTDALKTRVRTLLADLVKSEFKKLRSEVDQELRIFTNKERAMGPPRSDPNAQRAYLSNLCDQFQSITRDALCGSYVRHSDFFGQESRRLITRIVELDEQFSAGIENHGYTMPFAGMKHSQKQYRRKKKGVKVMMIEPKISPPPLTVPDSSGINLTDIFPIIARLALQDSRYKDRLNDIAKSKIIWASNEDIMQYIRQIYSNSRSTDLGTFNGSLLATAFMEQSKPWEAITTAYIELAILLVETFVREVIQSICSDSQVEEELCEVILHNYVPRCFNRAKEHAKSLLNMERGCAPWTLNRSFQEDLSKNQGNRLIANIKAVAKETKEATGDGCEEDAMYSFTEATGDDYKEDATYSFTEAQLQSLATHNQSNAEQLQIYIHDILKSYYNVAVKRFIDNVCLHVVHHDLLLADDSPLNVFNFKFVHRLDEDQLDQIAGESHVVGMEREKLAREIKSFKAAINVLKGGYSARDMDY